MYKNNFTRPAENETPIEIEICNDFSQNQEDFWQYFTRLTPNRQYQANIYYYNDDVSEIPPEIEELRDLDDSDANESESQSEKEENYEKNHNENNQSQPRKIRIVRLVWGGV